MLASALSAASGHATASKGRLIRCTVLGLTPNRAAILRTLSPVSLRAFRAADRITGNKPLPTNIRDDIVERTDGIPLFVEEMTKAVLEAENEGASERVVAAIPSPSLTVPPSLHASLMARLDRLGSAKEIAQFGAVIGREFCRRLLATVANKSDAELQSGLDSLIEAGLLFGQGVPPHTTYLFKHALIQDAAYSTLLREPRRVLHTRIAESLESQFSEIAENQPELLAHHCTEAGLIEKAAGLWGKAGQRSLERSALVEAVAHLTRALDQIATLPPSPNLRREQINLQSALITPLIHVKGYAAPETKAAAEQAKLLIEQAEERGETPEDYPSGNLKPVIAPALWGRIRDQYRDKLSSSEIGRLCFHGKLTDTQAAAGFLISDICRSGDSEEVGKDRRNAAGAAAGGDPHASQRDRKALDDLLSEYPPKLREAVIELCVLNRIVDWKLRPQIRQLLDHVALWWWPDTRRRKAGGG